MDRRKQNLQAMHEAVIRVFDDHPVQTALIPVLSSKAAQVKTLHTTIKTLATDRLKLKSGVTVAKKSAKKALGSTTFAISQSLLEFARLRDDQELAGAMNYTATSFYRLSDAEIETVARVVLDKLKELLPLLTDLNLKQTDVDDLQAKLDLYVARKSTPRNRSNQSKDLTGRLSELFFDMAELLKSCDRMVLRLKDSEPQFYNVYTSARLIVDRGGSQAPASTGNSSGVADSSDETPAFTPATNAVENGTPVMAG